MDEPGWRADPDIQPPFEVIEPLRLAAPLVFNSPHSGSHYPRAFLAASRLDPLTLRRSEDAFVDELFLPCVQRSARRCCGRAFRARFSTSIASRSSSTRGCSTGRCPTTPTPARCASRPGSATIPRVVGDAQPIYRDRVPVADALARIAILHRPYHQRLGWTDRTHAGALRRGDPDRLPFDALDARRGGRARHRARRPVRRQRRAVGGRGARDRRCWRAAIASAATSLTPAATSPSITACPPPAVTPCRSRSIAPFTWTRRAW